MKSLPKAAHHSPDDAQEEAIAWAVKLASGHVDAAERQAFQRWHDQHHANKQAWRRIEGIDEVFSVVPCEAGDVVRRTLNHLDDARLTRRTVLKLLIAGAFLFGGGLTLSHTPWQRTWPLSATAQQRRHRLLPDGSRIDLNRGSAVDVVFSPWRRRVLLHQGEIHIETGNDADALFGHRPFEVVSGTMTFRALGTAFNLRRDRDGHRLYVSDGQVAVYHHGSLKAIVSATQEAVATDSGVIEAHSANNDPSTWTQGVLVARKMRLRDLAAELSRYGDRHLRCTAQAGDLRVSGVFQIDGPAPLQRAVTSLRQSLPIDVIEQDDTLTLILARR